MHSRNASAIYFLKNVARFYSCLAAVEWVTGLLSILTRKCKKRKKCNRHIMTYPIATSCILRHSESSLLSSSYHHLSSISVILLVLDWCNQKCKSCESTDYVSRFGASPAALLVCKPATTPPGLPAVSSQSDRLESSLSIHLEPV